MSTINKFALAALAFFPCSLFCEERNFLLYDLNSKQWLEETGPHCDERASPCSTFKIPLCIIGFDSGILENENLPVWPYQVGYVNFLPVWKQMQTPSTWMQNSVVWFSQVLTTKLGMQAFQYYIDLFDYGNKDLSGNPGKEDGLTESWLISSLAISPREQIFFLSKLLSNTLPVSAHSMEMTRKILYLEELDNGWKLYGKTGSGHLSDPELKTGWFIGWIEKEEHTVLFTYYLVDDEKIGGFGGLRAKKNARERLIEFSSKR